MENAAWALILVLAFYIGPILFCAGDVVPE